MESEIDFADDTHQPIRGKGAKRLREDFCGTANASCEWVRRRLSNIAVGLDLDPNVLNWGHQHKVGNLDETPRKRITFLQQDALQAECQPTNIILAMNFSHQLFKTRGMLRLYFTKAYGILREDGVLFIDAYSGSDSYRTIRERQNAGIPPITGDMLCHIHFRFPDQSWMEKAFTYDWRMWKVPEFLTSRS